MLNEENDCEICAALKDFSNQIQTKLFFVIVEENETNKLLPLPCGRFLLAETEEMLLKRIQQKKSYVRAYCKNKMYTAGPVSRRSFGSVIIKMAIPLRNWQKMREA